MALNLTHALKKWDTILLTLRIDRRRSGHWQHKRRLLNLQMIQYLADNDWIINACKYLHCAATGLACFDEIFGLLY
jgi:hypothetical protein